MDASEINDKPSNQEDIHHQRLAKQRDHNTATVNSLLLIETKSLVENKVREDIMQRTMQFHLREMNEIKSSMNQPIKDLIARKEMIREQIQLESVYRSQTEKEMFNTEKMKDLLTEHYGKMQSTYECEYRNYTELKNKCNEQRSNYQQQKENILKLIDEKKAQICGIQDLNERDLQQYQTLRSEKGEELIKLAESIDQIESEMENAKKQLEVLKSEVEKNNTDVMELKQNIYSVQNSVNNYTLLSEELEAKRTRDKENNDLVLNKALDELCSLNEHLAELQRKEIDLEELCAQESNQSTNLDETLSELDEKKSELVLEVNELTKRRDDIITKSNDQQLNLKNELINVQLKHSEAKECLISISATKENKLKYAQNLQQKNQEDELKLVELQSMKDKLLSDNVTNLAELERLALREDEKKRKIDTLIASLTATQRKHLQEEEKNEKLNSELDYKLLSAQNQLQQVTVRYETTCKDLETKVSSHKYQLQIADQQNQEDNKKILDEFKAEVAKLKSDYDEKRNSLTETNKLIIEKRELYEKLLKESDDLHKSNLSRGGFKRPTPGDAKPTGILKSPGKTAASPKKVKFDVEKSSVTESESGSQSNAKAEVWKQLFK